MERKDYEKMLYNIKNKILKEIRTLVPIDTVHYFKDAFPIRYIHGGLVSTELCAAVEVENNEMVIFHVRCEDSNETDMVVGEGVFDYDPQTFLDILDHLKKEIREEKLSKLREIVKKNGGRIKFDGKFEFNLFDASNDCEVWPCLLESLYIDDASGRVIVDNKFNGGGYTNGEDCLLSEELDSIIAYCEKETFNLTAEQEKAIDEFDAAATKLAKAGVSIIRDNVNDDLYFINGKNVKQFGVNPDVAKGAKEITDIVKNARCIHCFLEAAFYSADEDKIFAEMSD